MLHVLQPERLESILVDLTETFERHCLKQLIVIYVYTNSQVILFYSTKHQTSFHQRNISLSKES